MKQKLTAAFFMVLAVALAAPAQQSANMGTAMQASGVAAPAPEPKSLGGPEYVIGPDDALHISVWKEPDLTATLPVRPDGKISLPLLNDVQAAGLTPVQLADSLTTKLKKYVADPRVTVVVTQINSNACTWLEKCCILDHYPCCPT